MQTYLEKCYAENAIQQQNAADMGVSLTNLSANLFIVNKCIYRTNLVAKNVRTGNWHFKVKGKRWRKEYESKSFEKIIAKVKERYLNQG